MNKNTQLSTLPPTDRAIVALDFDAVKAEVSKLANQFADINLVASHYQVSEQAAHRWLTEMFGIKQAA